MMELHPELYEEEYRRTMKSISWALHFMDERGLGYQVDRKLREHIEEKRMFAAETLKRTNEHADNYYLPIWINYLKRIPKQGLNNMTQKPRWGQHGHHNPVPTLPRRLKSISMTGPFDSIKLPFFYYHMEIRTSRHFKRYIDNIPKIQEITKQIVERLDELHAKMDTVTVLSESEHRHWKNAIRFTALYIRKNSGWVGLELTQKAEFEVLEEKEQLING